MKSKLFFSAPTNKHYRAWLIIVVAALLFSLEIPAIHAQNPGISSPTNGQAINGVVLVTGTADDPNFLRYELAFLRESDGGTGWIVFADGTQPILNGTLAVWDTTVGQNVNAPVFPDGQYQLRLRVVRQDFNYDEYFVTTLSINNGQAAPIPTDAPIIPTAVPIQPSATIPPAATLPPNVAITPSPSLTPTEIPTPTPLVTREAPTLIPTLQLDPTLAQPDVLPSLTPFPSPQAVSTTETGGFTGIIQDVEPQDAVNALEDLAAFDFSQFGEAFRNGFLWPFYIFGAIALYLIIRGLIRWLWRFISSNI